jgi:hypothetical protein
MTDAQRTAVMRAAVFLTALAPRLFIAFVTFGSVDLVANMRDSVRVLAGTLAETPYLPLNELWLWIAAHLAFHTAVPLAFMYKLLPVVADALIALLLFEAVADRRAAWLYALAPVPIIIMAVHGQWDSQWLLFALLAVVLMRIERPAGAAAAGAAIILAVIAKPVAAPIALLLLPWHRRRAVAYIAGGTALLAIYIAVLWLSGWLLTLDQLMGIVRYAQRGVVLFGLPRMPIPRLWSIAAAAIVLWLLVVRRKITREEAVMLFVCVTLGVSGLAPQYLSWLVPFVLLCGRMRFAAVYSLIVGLFLLVYYQLPALNGFNVENMGAWGFLKPLGGWSPALPDVQWRATARLAGNLVIPLLCLGYAALQLIPILQRRKEAAPQPAPATGLRVAIPIGMVAALVLLLFGVTLGMRKPGDLEFAYRVEQKAAAYDVVRYRGAIPPDKRRMKIWIARSYTPEGAANRALNVNTIGAIWILAWSAAAALSSRMAPK